MKKIICFCLIFVSQIATADTLIYKTAICDAILTYDSKKISQKDLENIMLLDDEYCLYKEGKQFCVPSELSAEIKKIFPKELSEKYDYNLRMGKYNEWIKARKEKYQKSKNLDLLVQDSPDKKIDLSTCEKTIKQLKSQKEENRNYDDFFKYDWPQCLNGVAYSKINDNLYQKKLESNWQNFFKTYGIQQTFSNCEDAN